MSFVQPQENTTRRSVVIVAAVLFHIVLIWALMNGLAKKVAQVISEPIETKIIEAVKPPPPPEKVIELPPPPKFVPQPAFVPLPEIQIQTPAPMQPTISAVTAEPVAAPVVVKPVAAPVISKPASVSASVACSNYSKVMGDAAFPRAATRLGLEEGDALVQFTLTANGEIKDVKAIKSSHAVFAENSIRLVSTFKCAGRGSDVFVQVPFEYKVE
jgi:periplasmic protein TonB